MSTYPERRRPSETVAGYLSALSLFASLIGIVYRPVRIIPFAVVLALIALGMGGRNERLAWLALAVSAVAWVVGMSIAITVDHPLW